MTTLDAAKGTPDDADVRVVPKRTQNVSTRGERVSGVFDNETYGFGIRILVRVVWDIAGSRDLTRDAVSRAAERVGAEAVRRITGPAKVPGLVSKGFMDPITSGQSLSNNRSLFAYNRSTSSVLTTTPQCTLDGTGRGWAGGTHYNWSNVDPAALSVCATRKSRTSEHPARLAGTSSTNASRSRRIRSIPMLPVRRSPVTDHRLKASYGSKTAL